MHHRVIRNGSPLDDRFDNIARAARRAGYTPTLFGYTDIARDPRTLHPKDPAGKTYEELLPGFVWRQPLPEDDAPWLSWLSRRRGGARLTKDIHRVPLEPGERISLAPPDYAADETQTAFLVDTFLDWLGEQTGPWFAHISFLRPHPPFAVPEPYAGMYSPDDGPNFTATDVTGHPLAEALRQSQSIETYIPGIPGRVGDLTEREFRRIRAIYWGMISEVDAQIGRLAAAVGDNALFVLTSDHAEMMGDHRMLGKGGFFPESYHIPLIVRGPDVTPGRRVEALTSATDIFPTLLGTMDVAPRHAPDGRSLRPYLQGETPEDWREAVHWEFDFRSLLGEIAALSREILAREAHLIARHSASGTYVHSPAMPSLTLGEATDDPGRLLSDVMRMFDETLAAKLVWEH
jgi:arylsulfatase A-like enzyme